MRPADTVHFGNPPHLHIVCTDPVHDGKAIVFNASTHKFGKDIACILQPGDHPLIIWPSCIMYEFGELWTPQQFNSVSLISKHSPPVSEIVLRSVQAGALKSSETKPKFKKIFEAMAIDLFEQFLRSFSP